MKCIAFFFMPCLLLGHFSFAQEKKKDSLTEVAPKDSIPATREEKGFVVDSTATSQGLTEKKDSLVAAEKAEAPDKEPTQADAKKKPKPQKNEAASDSIVPDSIKKKIAREKFKRELFKRRITGEKAKKSKKESTDKNNKDLDSTLPDSLKKKELTKAEKRKAKREQRKVDTLNEPKVFNYKKYQFISYERDTTYLDTSLNIHKYYKFNYLRKDMAGIMPFPNDGQPYTKLEQSFVSSHIYPEFGATAKHFGYEEKEDTRYYSMASPTTELFYKNSVDQGQIADTWISVNTSKRFNVTWNYAGLRSLGKLKNFLSDNSKNVFSINYHTKNERYQLRAHFVDQTYNNKENGGLSTESEFEEQGKTNFSNQNSLNVNYIDGTSELYGRRYFLENRFFILQKATNKYLNLSLGHEYMYHIKYFMFSQGAPSAVYGNTIENVRISNNADYREHQNKFFLEASNKYFGSLKAGLTVRDFQYFFERRFYGREFNVPNLLEVNQLEVSGKWESPTIKNIKLQLEGAQTLTKTLPGTRVAAKLSYNPEKAGFYAEIEGSVNQHYPKLTALIYQSNFRSYNWNNFDSFSQESVTNASLSLRYKKIIGIKADYSILNNYTYFQSVPQAASGQPTTPGTPSENNVEIIESKPYQYKSPLTFLKLRADNEFKLWKFGMQNTVIFQTVTANPNILNVPQITTRNSLYFFSDVFKKAMYLEVGVGLKYFTQYYADGYNPLIGDYYVQNRKLIGNFPIMDAFINMRVKQTRLFLIVEHFNSSFNETIYYSAPRYPYRDLTIRFGIVWNFFM